MCCTTPPIPSPLVLLAGMLVTQQRRETCCHAAPAASHIAACRQGGQDEPHVQTRGCCDVVVQQVLRAGGTVVGRDSDSVASLGEASAQSNAEHHAAVATQHTQPAGPRAASQRHASKRSSLHGQ